jgi:hypothetical protein
VKLKYFSIEESKSLYGSPKKILIHKNTGGIVVHMVAIFDVIHEAHCRLGHLAVDKTLAATKPAFYSPRSHTTSEMTTTLNLNSLLQTKAWAP